MLMIDSLHMTTDKTAGVFHKPQQIIGVRTVKKTRRVTSVRTHNGAWQKFWIHDSIAAAYFGKKVAPVRLLGSRAPGNNRVAPENSVNRCDNRSTFGVHREL